LVKFTVISGKASEELSKRISRILKAEYIKSDLKVFPDGESKITISKKPKTNRLVVVQSIYPPVDSNLIRAISSLASSKFSFDRIKKFSGITILPLQ